VKIVGLEYETTDVKADLYTFGAQPPRGDVRLCACMSSLQLNKRGCAPIISAILEKMIATPLRSGILLLRIFAV
jgi:hypothetical protein